MGDEAGRMTAEPCAGCGCKWKRCKPDTPGSDTGVVVCAYCGTFQSRYEFTDLPAAPVGGDEGQTDLPDAVVNAAVEAFARKRNPKHNTLDHSETLAIRAALAAASGPWAEQLDAAKADRDEALLRLKRIIELEPVAHAAEQIRESDGSFTTQIAGVRLEKCDEYGHTKTTTELAAALARNAELQHEVEGLTWRNQQLTERLEQAND